MTAMERFDSTNITPTPEFATLSCGSCNFGDEIFENTEDIIKTFATEMKKKGIKPELECFDKGMIDIAMKMHKKGYLDAPMHFDFVLGVQMSATVRDLSFCVDSLPPGKHDRTFDQMIQAARSGKQNIVEGCIDMATSTASGLMLINVARGSLRELKEDFYDYIRVHGAEPWQKSSAEYKTAQKIGRERLNSNYYIELTNSRSDTATANIIIVLIEQTDYLIYRLIESLAEKFKCEGGFKERMYSARTKSRGY